MPALITLAFDTATPAPALALLRGAEPLLERTLPADRGAGRRVAEEIHRALVDAGLVVRDVSRIVVGIGPGGFTGLRIGIATALALGQALDVPVVGVSTLEALALGMAGDVPDGGLLVPVIDAKRQEVFTAAYRAAGDGGLEVVAEPRAATVSGMAELTRPSPQALSRRPSGITPLSSLVHTSKSTSAPRCTAWLAQMPGGRKSATSNGA